jgi:PAS domain S-box-containing protein
MEDKERIRTLEEQVEYLNKEKRAILEAIELAANLGNFHTSLNKIDDPVVILHETQNRISNILNFKTVSFFIVSEEDSNFYRALTEPASEAGNIDREVNALIDDKTFAWALRRNKPVTVSSIDKKEKIVLHSMNTPSRTRGIFVGILANPVEEILDLSLFLFSITIIACSNALESFELYRRIKDKNKELEESIVELDRSARKLQEEERKYRGLFEESTNSIILYDPDTRLPVEFNHLANEHLGYTAAEFKEKRMEEYSQMPVEDIAEKMRRTVKEGQFSFETIHRRKDGETRDIAVNARAISMSGKTYILTLLNDMTERKKAEEERLRLEKQLLQSQKMESIGTLAGGIAHDFNNILGVVLGYGELMLMDLPEDQSSTFRQNTESLLNAVHRARELVQQILTFSRRSEEVRTPVDVGNITEETLKLLRATLPPTIDVRQKIGDGANVIMGTSNQVHRVLMNLCTNAIHAMEGGSGILEVEVQTTRFEGGAVPGKITAFESMEPGSYVEITVTDTGHGIGPRILPRVFDPYFTTKGPGEGTGLGLSVVHGIAKKYRGNVSIDNRAGKGTVVRVWFPAAVHLEIPGKKETEALPSGKETIILVDDEEELLKFYKLILGKLGYTVFTYSSTSAALESFLDDPVNFDLIITDVAMVGMSGIELAAEVSNIRRDIPIILCTGFSEYMDAQREVIVNVKEYIMKPVDKYTLTSAIRRVLDRDHLSEASR